LCKNIARVRHAAAVKPNGFVHIEQDLRWRSGDAMIQPRAWHHAGARAKESRPEPGLCTRRDLADTYVAKERQQVKAQADVVPFKPKRAALALGDDTVFLGELFGRLFERLLGFQ
jgi:hypothetical protein